MGVRIAGYFLLLFGWVGLVWGQGFVAIIMETDEPLTTTCGGDTPIPDNTLYLLYHDANENGPDTDDTLATLCDLPPGCETGPARTLNWNAAFFNGDTLGIGPGYFYSDPAFVAVSASPQPNRFYVRVYYPNLAEPQILWESEVFSPPGGICEIELAGWACTNLPPPCIPTVSLSFAPVPDYGPQDLTACASLCPDTRVWILVGPLHARHRQPSAHITAGCADSIHAAPVWHFDNEAWQFAYANGDSEFFFGNEVWVAAGEPEGYVTVHLDSVRVTSAVPPEQPGLTPALGTLYPNYPNPFNTTTTLRFDLARPGRVRLAVYNLAGQEAAILVDAYREAGRHDVRFDGRTWASGVYVCRLSAGDFSLQSKMLLLK